MSKQHLNQQTNPSPTMMKDCIRCHGFLVSVHMMDMQQLTMLWEQEQRCINCGWVSGPTIHPHVFNSPRQAKAVKPSTFKRKTKKPQNKKLGTIPFLTNWEIENSKFCKKDGFGIALDIDA